MSLRDVVRRDLYNAYRARGGLWSSLRVFLVVVVPGYYLIDGLTGPRADVYRQALRVYELQPVRPEAQLPSHTDAFVILMGLLIGLLVPLLVMLDASDAVVAERQDGTMKLLLTLPNSRADVFFGKVAARSLLVLIPLIGGLAVLAVVAQVLAGAVPWEALVGLVAFSTLLVVCFVGIGVAISAMASSTRGAVQTGLGAYFVLGPLWRVFEYVLVLMGVTSSKLAPLVGWALFVGELGSPVWTAMAALELLLEPGTRWPTMFAWFGGDGLGDPRLWVGVVLAWLVSFLVLGYLAFRRADLG